MQTRTKVIFFRIAIVLVCVLFIGGYFHQRFEDKKQASFSKESPQEENQSSEAFTPFQEKKEEKAKENTSVSPNAGKKLADFYSSEDIQNSKKVAEEFVRSLYPVDGKDLNKSTNQALSYTTENLTKMMKSEENGIARPTIDFFSRELKEISTQEPDEATPDALTWVVTAKGDIKNEKGEVTDHDTTTYLLQVIKEKDNFKVAEFSENPNE